jgi:hypothetical protein
MGRGEGFFLAKDGEAKERSRRRDMRSGRRDDNLRNDFAIVNRVRAPSLALSTFPRFSYRVVPTKVTGIIARSRRRWCFSAGTIFWQIREGPSPDLTPYDKSTGKGSDR